MVAVLFLKSENWKQITKNEVDLYRLTLKVFQDMATRKNNKSQK